MKQTLLSALALAGLFAGPGAAMAATYEYVSMSGTIMTVEAADANAAILAAPFRATNSGVILVMTPSQSLPDDMTVTIDPTPPVTQMAPVTPAQ